MQLLNSIEFLFQNLLVLFFCVHIVHRLAGDAVLQWGVKIKHFIKISGLALLQLNIDASNSSCCVLVYR